MLKKIQIFGDESDSRDLGYRFLLWKNIKRIFTPGRRLVTQKEVSGVRGILVSHGEQGARGSFHENRKVCPWDFAPFFVCGCIYKRGRSECCESESGLAANNWYCEAVPTPKYPPSTVEIDCSRNTVVAWTSSPPVAAVLARR